MLHCYNCGADMPDNMLFCTRCGKKLDSPEQETRILGQGAAPTAVVGGQTGPMTQPVVVQKKRGGGLKAFLIVLVSLIVLGGIGVVAAAMLWTYSKRQSVVVNANIPRPANVPDIPNINGIAANTNAAIDDAIEQIQKAANDALAAANQAANIKISTGKKLDAQTNRITFRPGATSAVAVGTIEDEATFVMRAKAGQKLTGKITAPGGCVKFDSEDPALTLETDDGDNYLTVVNSCGKPTSMVLTISIK